MKEDVLEQVVEDYLQARGYFTITNVRFKPDKNHPDYVGAKDSVAGHIDIVGYNPLPIQAEHVRAVSCKAWQSGFDAAAELRSGARRRTPHERRGSTSASVGDRSGPRRSTKRCATPRVRPRSPTASR